jgi:hypothetical protein
LVAVPDFPAALTLRSFRIMNQVAQFSPSDYVDKLQGFKVPGYTGMAYGLVELRTYLSGNPSANTGGGNSEANVLSLALRQIAQKNNDEAILSRPGYGRLFNGQGSIDNFQAAFEFIVKYQADFKDRPELAKYFYRDPNRTIENKAYLQDMVNDKCFGMDCIGFVGTYLAAAGVFPSYVSHNPIDWSVEFPFVKSLDEIKDNQIACVMLTNGWHIQLIDHVKERRPATNKGPASIIVDLCQSASGGPQCNEGVTLFSGGGDALDVDAFRAAKDANKYRSEYEADEAQRKEDKKRGREYEDYLRSRFTTANKQIGWKGGAIFHLMGDGDPKNPVSNYVYVGVAPNGLTVGTP